MPSSASTARPEGRRGRIAKACSQCRAAKTRCTFTEGSLKCDKCIQRGLECTMLPKGAYVGQTAFKGQSTTVKAAQHKSRGQRRASALKEVKEEFNCCSECQDSQSHSNCRAKSPSLKHVHSHDSPELSQGQARAATDSPFTEIDAFETKGGAFFGSISPSDSQYNGWIGDGSPTNLSGSASSVEKTDPVAIDSVSITDVSMSGKDLSDPSSNPPQIHRPSIADSTSVAPQSLRRSEGSFEQDLSEQGFGDISYQEKPQILLQQQGGSSVGSASVVSNVSSHSMSSTGNPTIEIHPAMSDSTPLHNPTIISVNGIAPETLDGTDVNSHSVKGWDTRTSPPPTENLAADSTGTLELQADHTGEYFLNLGVFPEPMTKEMMRSRSQSPSQDPMIDSSVNPLVPMGHSRYRFQHSAASMVLQAIDPVLQDQLGSISRLLLPPRRVSSRNVVNQRILTFEQVVRLFAFFKGNYNHWVSLPDAEPEELANYLLEQCPLLVTTCCCIALRFGSSELWRTTYPALVRYLTYELAQTLVSLPQNIECLQALTILAKYADALSYGDFVFDMWYMSGIGLQHLETVASLNNQFTYIHMRLWNHLVLAHVASANMTGRGVLMEECGIQMCRLVLDEGLSTRFDSCMVAEIMIQWQLNRYFSRKIRFSEFEKGVSDWQQEWGMLAQLPIIQFIEPVLLFCCFLARWTHARRCFETNTPPISPQGEEFTINAAQRMSTQNLQEELQNLNVIINELLSMVHSDYFGCLSDNLHAIGFTSAVMSVVIAKVIMERGETVSMESKQNLDTSSQLVSQLAGRFRATSRGQDVFQSRCVALDQLLKSSSYGN